ncbi:MAG: NADH-quinone oxidoreductase subunit H [Candidatus Omnitrophica bacterium]|nr:NADH-quinone oxidoreductase subunit H [Candidatus Omnitrophota bacterium]
MIKIFAQYLIFPGIVFSFLIGAMGFWLERKLTARFQYRIGPPWYQNFIDVTKLFLKETILPKDASRMMFMLSPIVSLSATALVCIILANNYFLNRSFLGDIIVVLYLLLIPSLFTILGALSSKNPLALVGAAREIKLMLAYEFVFITCLIIAIVKSGNSVMLSDITGLQILNKPNIISFSGAIAVLLSIFYVQAKLCIVPFDAAEAEQEIMAGTVIEYSGPLLGFYKISKLMLYFSLPLFIISLFIKIRTQTTFERYLVFFLIYILIIFVMSVIKNINPRMRIKDAVQFFWFLLFPLGILGIILAQLGL